MNFNDLPNKWAIDVDINDVERFLRLCEDAGIVWCDGKNALHYLPSILHGDVGADVNMKPRFLHNVNGRRGLSISRRIFRYQDFGAGYAKFEDLDEYLPGIQESCVDSLLHDFI